MAAPKIGRYVRPFEDVRRNLLERARNSRNPFDFTRDEEVEQILSRLSSVDYQPWAEAFGAAARPYEEKARLAEAAADAPARGRITCGHTATTGWHVIQH